jgi:hypothetical protein
VLIDLLGSDPVLENCRKKGSGCEGFCIARPRFPGMSTGRV